MIIRYGFVIIGGAIVFACAWIVFAPLSGAIIAPGVVRSISHNERLTVEARVPADQIKRVHVGSEADIRVMVPQGRTTALMPGAVMRISGDVVHVDVQGSAARRLHPVVGMQAEVFIRTSKRTALDDLLRRALQREGADAGAAADVKHLPGDEAVLPVGEEQHRARHVVGLP